MLPTLEVERRDMVFIPIGADKGDCPRCIEGVLRREHEVEKQHKVREGYQCDTCGRHFIEGFSLRFDGRRFSYNNRPSIPGRYFVEADVTGLDPVY